MEVDVLSLTIYCLFFLFLALAGIHGKGKWRQRGMVTGFIVALFTEMWGFPLSIFIITSLAGGRNLPYQFDNLMYYFTQPHSSIDVAFFDPPVAWLAEYTIARGIALLSVFPIIYGWFHLKKNVNHGLVTDGPYAFTRNPQYIGFMLFVVGMTMYWPTLITIPMGCVLCFAYYWLARKEEKSLIESSGEAYFEYARKVPRFMGRETYKIFQLPRRLGLVEKLVEVAFLLPFVLWFAESVVGLMVGVAIVRDYWFPIAYVLPVHLGVIIAIVLLAFAGLGSMAKRYL